METYDYAWSLIHTHRGIVCHLFSLPPPPPCQGAAPSSSETALFLMVYVDVLIDMFAPSMLGIATNATLSWVFGTFRQ